MSNREPLLSDEDVESFIDEWANGGKRSDYAIRDFYEDKITKGELMVVKAVKAVRTGSTKFYTAPAHCSECHSRLTYYDEEEQEQPMPNFCPGCGSKIIEP